MSFDVELYIKDPEAAVAALISQLPADGPSWEESDIRELALAMEYLTVEVNRTCEIAMTGERAVTQGLLRRAMQRERAGTALHVFVCTAFGEEPEPHVNDPLLVEDADGRVMVRVFPELLSDEALREQLDRDREA